MPKPCLLILSIALLVLSSCDGILNLDVVGDGNRVVRERDLSSFSKVYLDADFVVELKSGLQQVVEVICDSNLQVYVITEVDGNQLSIGRKPNFDLSPRQPIRVKIQTPALSELSVLGGGKMITDTINTSDLKCFIYGVSELKTGFLDCTLLELFAEGSTRLNLNGDFRKIQITQKGSGEIVLSGNGKSSEITLEGSGKIDARSFEVPFSEVNLYGSGLVFCFASEVLNAFINGNGRVYYFGSPITIKKEIIGEGLVVPGQ